MLVVVDAPVLDQHPRLLQAGEQLDREELVAHTPAEALDVGVLPRRAGLDVRAAGPAEAALVHERVGGHLRSVIAAQEPRCRPALGDEPIERADSLVGVYPTVVVGPHSSVHLIWAPFCGLGL